MLDTLKSTLFASLGVVAIAQEKLKSCVDELVHKGELSKEQGEKVFATLVQKGEEESSSLSERLSIEVSRLLQLSPFVSRREFEALEERVRALEASLAARAPDEVEPSSSA